LVANISHLQGLTNLNLNKNIIEDTSAALYLSSTRDLLA